MQYMPQENALAERINRTLLNKVRATLAHSCIHATHRQDTLHDAVFQYHIKCHHTTRAILHTQWYNTVPRIKSMFVFGQLG